MNMSGELDMDLQWTRTELFDPPPPLARESSMAQLTARDFVPSTKPLRTSAQWFIEVPSVTASTGPISGETSIDATNVVTLSVAKPVRDGLPGG